MNVRALGLLLGFAALLRFARACPPACVCFSTSATGYRVDCTEQRLTEVPADIPVNVTYLDLSDNYIDVLRLGSLDRFPSLIQLDLSKNGLKNVDEGIFANLSKLETLRLFYTKIREINEHFLEGLTSLKRLEAYGSTIAVVHPNSFRSLLAVEKIDLSQNNLKLIDSHTFVGLPALKQINLNDNRIKTLRLASFMNLHNLTTVFLSGNRLTTIKQGTFIATSKLRTMYLKDNLFTCDCDILWIHQFVVERDLPDVVCHKPAQLRNRLFIHLTKVDICGGPEFYAQPMPSMYSRLNATVGLVCGAIGTPHPEIFWSFENKSIANDPRFSVTYSGDLIVHNVTSEDSGTYYCTAMSRAGVVVARGDLIVGDVPRFSGVTNDFTEIGVSLGQPASLRCELTANPKPAFKWFFEGAPVADWMNERLLEMGNVLIVTDVRNVDAGRYMCTADNRIGIASQEFILTLNEPPVVRTPLSNAWYPTGANVTLLCPIRGFPSPRVTWYVDGVTITGDKEAEEKVTPTELVVLTGAIQNATENTTVPSTPTAIPTSQIPTSAAPIPTPTSAPPTNCSVQNCSLLNSTAGELSGDGDGDGDVVATSMPPSPAARSQRFLRRNGILEIRNIQPSDSGNYRCDAVNSVGQASTSSYISVGGYGRPVVVVDSPTVTALAGCTAIMRCNATGTPDPDVAWLFDSQTLDRFVSGQRRFVSPSSSELVVTEVSVDDEGYYECRAKNIAGTSTESVRLLVLSAPRFVRRSNDTTVDEHESIRLDCTVDLTLQPSPIVNWFVNGRSLPDADNFPRHALSNDRSSLYIERARPSDAGFYACEARNEVGTIMHSLTVSVHVPLRFDAVPSDASIPVGEAVAFRCVATASPVAPIVKWFRHGVPIDVHSPLYVVGSESLVILKARRSDTGWYTCMASIGSANISRSALLDVLVPPAFVSSAASSATGTREVKRGLNATFTCTVSSGNPVPEITWKKDGAPLVAVSQFRLSRDGSQLTINPSKPSDSGVYTCTASNGVGASPSIDHRLLVWQPPRISQESHAIVVDAGDSIVIPCSASGSPTPTMKWDYSHQPLPSDGRFHIQSDGSLIVLNVGSSDMGELDCMAKNDYGADVIIIELIVNRLAAKHPVINMCPTPFNGFIGTRATFRCDATGTPPPRIAWLSNGVLVNASAGFNVSDNGRELVVPVLSARHEGQVTCVARNSQGVTRYTVPLTVARPPTFVKYPDTTPQRVGRTVVLTCTFEGSPKPDVIWAVRSSNGSGGFADDWSGIPYESGRHFQLVDGSLLIADLRLGDAGEYECTGTNGIADATVATFLSVDGDETSSSGNRLRWASSLVGDGNVTIVAGETGVLRCDVDSHPPAAFVWRLNGAVLTAANGNGYFITANGTFVIPDASVSASGDYTCLVSNGLRQLSRLFRVEVPVSPTIREGPMSRSYPWTDFTSANRPAILRCVVEGSPAPDILWRKGNTMILPEGKYRIDSEGSLIIDPLEFVDAGEYTCVALNKAGVASATATVLVQDDRPRSACNTRIVYEYLRRGNCRSKAKVDNVMCEGFCFSETYPPFIYPFVTARQFCCRVDTTVSRDVEVICDDGSERVDYFQTAAACRCAPCAFDGQSIVAPMPTTPTTTGSP